MIGFVDTHLIMALQAAWDRTKDLDATEWRAIFSSSVPAELLDEAWDYLGGRDVSFRSVWTTQAQTVNDVIVAVELIDEQVTPPTFAFNLRRNADSDEEWNIHMTSTVGIYVYAPTKEVVRCLHVWIHAALLSSLGWLISTGIDGIEYGGAKDIVPEEALRPDGGNYYVRMQTWQVRGVEVLHRVGGSEPLVMRYVTVHDRSTFTDAVRDAESRTTVDLADNLAGGVDPEPES